MPKIIQNKLFNLKEKDWGSHKPWNKYNLKRKEETVRNTFQLHT